jgi:Xaa-Pro aminopeptidase
MRPPSSWPRAIKGPGELHRIEAAARATETAFDRLPDLIRTARTERHLHRAFQHALLAAGADAVPYLAIGSGPGGYDSLTRGPTDRAIAPGDVIALDTGAVVDGDRSDFDRNLAIGDPGDAARAAHGTLHEATDRGLKAVRPGTRACDMWREIADALPDGASGIMLGAETTTRSARTAPSGTTSRRISIIPTDQPAHRQDEGRKLQDQAVQGGGSSATTRRLSS